MLALGFRPFFLAAGLAGALLIGLWLMVVSGAATPGYFADAAQWHAHEMLFGYSVAVIAGFLLTAVRNWTGREMPSGVHLAGLVSVWLLPRILFWMPDAPGLLVAVADLAFLPLLSIVLWRRLRHGANKTNRIFPVMLAGMAIANALMHAEVLGIGGGLGVVGYRLMLDLVVLLLLLLGGRVTPSFTKNAVPAAKPRQWPVLERLVIFLAVAVGLLHLAPVMEAVAAVLLCVLGFAQIARVAGWFHPGVWRVPILAVLHAGFLLLGSGLLLDGLSVFEVFPANLARHVTTIGGLGLVTLGMMSRVSLGHTGRVMRSAAGVNFAFVLLGLAVLFRVAGPLLNPDRYSLWVNVAGALWVLGFVLFLVIYLPILSRPRVDGRPG